MDQATAGHRRLNVLVLDGGGVRGLSSLLILRALMIQVNLALRGLGAPCGELHPHDVFQLVAGTSTGGLIALMLGKIGLTVEECLEKYEDLSKVLFGEKHWRGRMSFGLACARYSGKGLQNCVRKLLRERQLDEDLSMRHHADKMACAVVCREHTSASQYSKLKRTPVLICSLPCKNALACKVCDAARATSAAPTYFPVMKIGERFFADGGLEHNNPSFAIYFHYTSDERKKSTRSNTVGTPHFSPHGDLDCSRVRFTNIGTGARIDEVAQGKRDRLADLIPGPIRKVLSLKQTLTEIAVNSEEKADTMRQFEALKPEAFKYERFDATYGVSNIKLDRHDALREIRQKTEQYLDEQDTKDLLEEVAKAIATDYLNDPPTHQQDSPLTHSVVNQSRQPQLNLPAILRASSSVSKSSLSDASDAEPHVVLQKHDNAPESSSSPGQPKRLARQDLEIDTLSSAKSMAAAPA